MKEQSLGRSWGKGVRGRGSLRDKGKTQHGERRDPGRTAAMEHPFEEGGDSGRSQETLWARLEGWPRDTSEGFPAEKEWSDLHVRETTLHCLPHTRVEPKARVPYHFTETALAGAPSLPTQW